MVYTSPTRRGTKNNVSLQLGGEHTKNSKGKIPKKANKNLIHSLYTQFLKNVSFIKD